jgi:hypothetical protein
MYIKMIKRIKYIQEGDLLRSKDLLTNGKAKFLVVLNTKTLEFTIFNTDTNTVEQKGTAVSQHNLREKSKNRLKKLGVKFKTETRKKRPTKKDKVIEMSLEQLASMEL